MTCKRGINNEIKWKLALHINGEDKHSALYRSEFMGKGIQHEIHTPIIKGSSGEREFGEPRVYFFIDGDDREFKSQEEMIEAILEE